MMMMKKLRWLIGLLILACLMAGVMSFAMADSGSKKVTYLVGNWNTANKQVEFNSVTVTATIVDENTSGNWSGCYLVNSDVTIRNDITITGETHLILSNSGKMTVNANITIENGKALHIHKSSESTGTLVANKGIQAASGRSLIIHGGTVNASVNEDNGACIGGTFERDGGTVIIYGGTVTASNNHQYGAGIGGGYNGAGGTITIYGGEVRATGGYAGAGIGGGNGGAGGTITIYDGEVTAESGASGAGIGGGCFGAGGTITIYDGEVTAESKASGAGIGGGNIGAGGTITINGGTVKANGGTTGGGSGSGSGNGGAGGTITGNGGTVTANGGESGAGIGRGSDGSDGTITINGGTVTATGGTNGAGIGGGNNGNGGKVTISGGEVTATGGSRGAGIGGGKTGDGGTVTINGGMVKASAGDSNAGGIGKGSNAYTHSSLSVGDGIAVFGSEDNSTWKQIEKTDNDYARERYMKVWSAVTGIGLDPVTAEIPYGSTFSLTALFAPSTAYDQTVLWSAEGGVKLYTDEACTTEVGTGAVDTLTVYVKGASAGSAAVTVTSHEDTSISAKCSVTVTKGTPVISTVPTASGITVGDSLAKSTLTGGTASVEGTFAWKDSTITPALSDSEKTEYTVVFTPKDTANYSTAECVVTVKVSKNEEGGEEEKLEKKDLTAVPEALKELFDTLQELKQAMLTKLEINGTAATAEQTAFYDVKLLISMDGGKTWTEATEDNFPAGGITVTLDYPAGTNADDYDFSVCHMFTLNSTKLGTKAGDTEIPAVTKTAKGLRFTLKGLSPLAVAWAKTATPTAAPTTVPKTGDQSMPFLWLGLAVLGMIGILAAVIRRRKSGR